MALTDPLSITISGWKGGSALSLPRVEARQFGSGYSHVDGDTRLNLSHEYGRRTRRRIRLDLSKLTADPFIPDRNVTVSMSIFTVVDVPVAGFTNAEQLNAWKGMNALLAASTDTVYTAFLGGQS
jgi:hypothetical protein